MRVHRGGWTGRPRTSGRRRFSCLSLSDRAGLVPTTRDLRAFLEGHGDPAKVEVANRLGHDLRFFHWPIEFPEIFARGGFDVVLGNPPWEQLELDEEEFFGARAPHIAEAPTKAARGKLIAKLANENPILQAEYWAAKHGAEALNKFVRGSGRYPLTAVGRFNSYALFAELGCKLIGREGGAGLVVPTGIATDDTYKGFFANLIERRQLASLCDFENRKGLFPGVDSRYKFCLLTIVAKPQDAARFTFFAHRVEDLEDERRVFALSSDDLALFNPNSRTCPVFRTKVDMDLTRQIYKRLPVLVNEVARANPWGVSFKQGLFNLSGDSGLFRPTHSQHLVPLYEGKMVGMYNHRAASVVYTSSLRTRQNQRVPTRPEEYKDPAFEPTPLWWVPRDEAETRLGDWPHPWLLCFKDITSATNERTMIGAILPRLGVAHSLPIILPKVAYSAPGMGAFLLANLNTIVFDYVVRQKAGGLHLTFFIVRQCPVIPPDRITEADLLYVVDRVLRLTYTSRTMEPLCSPARVRWRSV